MNFRINMLLSEIGNDEVKIFFLWNYGRLVLKVYLFYKFVLIFN